jgi:hypothetical protein
MFSKLGVYQWSAVINGALMSNAGHKIVCDGSYVYIAGNSYSGIPRTASIIDGTGSSYTASSYSYGQNTVWKFSASNGAFQTSAGISSNAIATNSMSLLLSGSIIFASMTANASAGNLITTTNAGGILTTLAGATAYLVLTKTYL